MQGSAVRPLCAAWAARNRFRNDQLPHTAYDGRCPMDASRERQVSESSQDVDTLLCIAERIISLAFRK
jgi:hypothetical protein